MKKPPPDLPEKIGERVSMRSDRHLTGVLQGYNAVSKWARVQWDSHVDKQKATTICHLYELRRVK